MSDGAWVTQFAARHGNDGPVVTASRRGDTWTYTAKEIDSVGIRGLTEDEARSTAAELATMVAAWIVPADRAADEARARIASWLRAMEEPPPDEGDTGP